MWFRRLMCRFGWHEYLAVGSDFVMLPIFECQCCGKIKHTKLPRIHN